MKTLTDCWSEIYSYLKSRVSPKRRKRSYTEFYTQKYVGYDHNKIVEIDDFIEKVSFSIRWVYVEWWYCLDLYSLGWKHFDLKKSDDVFLTKEECIKSLWEDPIGIYYKKRKNHYKMLYDDKMYKRARLSTEMQEIEKILLKL